LPFKRLIACCINSRAERWYPAAILSNSHQKQEAKGRRAMTKPDIGYLPHENPCAQCGKPIAAPEWTEAGPRRISYLWHCQACDYKFEAMAFYEGADSEALAA
jgi:hypothetical protein